MSEPTRYAFMRARRSRRVASCALATWTSGKHSERDVATFTKMWLHLQLLGLFPRCSHAARE